MGTRVKAQARRFAGFCGRHKALVASPVVGVAAAVGVSAPAWAQAYNPTNDLTTLANSTGTELGPIVVAVVTALLGIFILMWGVHWVLGLFRARKSRV